MIRYFSLKILAIFDFYYQKKLFSFLKNRGYRNFDYIFDIGAHHGESIQLFLKNFKIKNIYSFEASNENFKILQKNTKKLQKKFDNVNILIENFAVGDEEKIVKMKQMNESSSSTINSYNVKSKYFKKKSLFLFSSKNKNFFSEIDVKQVSLSNYMIEKNINEIDFIKIDTEGYEYYVLKGLQNQFKKIGRPQLKKLKRAKGSTPIKTILYAPTWESPDHLNNYSSVTQYLLWHLCQQWQREKIHYQM